MDHKRSLLDLLVIQTGCVYISNLKFLPPLWRHRLALTIEERIPAEDYSLEEWNAVLRYMEKRGPKRDAESARVALIHSLRQA